MERGRHNYHRGISIVEVMVIVLILSILAIIIVPYFLNVQTQAKYEVCRQNRANIDALVQLYYVKEGLWPGGTEYPGLQRYWEGIGTDTNYFPSGATPTCPVNPLSPYTFSLTSYRVTGHQYDTAEPYTSH
ncbi:MAG: hypothetical protein ABIH66_01860 [bacterium]